MLRTRLCDLLGIDVPLVGAPLGLISGPELAAAVSNAGGLGIMSFSAEPPERLRAAIRRVRTLTRRPFGVNLILQVCEAAQVTVCLDEGVPVLSLFWGDPTPWVAPAHAAGAKVLHQVGSVAEARRAAAAGVDVIVAQGHEAGGHVAGRVGTMVLVPRLVDAVAPTPVVAAGGIADGRGLVAALALGAEGAAIGTRLLATPEAGAHPLYKQRIVEATEEDTVFTLLYGGGWPDAPHRVLRTDFVAQWLPDEARGQEQRPDEPAVAEMTYAGRRTPVQRFAAAPPVVDASGDIAAMSLYAGESAGLVHDIRPAAEVVRAIVAQAERIIADRMK